MVATMCSERWLAILLLCAAPALAVEGKFTNPQSGGAADPLTVLGPASVCADNQLARWNGASNTALQCSPLTVADTTGDITAPGALTISTAGSNGDITLDPHGTGIVISSTIKCGKTSNCNLYLDGFGGGYGVFSGKNWFTNDLGATTSSSGSIGWTSGAANNPRDLVIARDAANSLAQRNSTNAQTYRLYGTYTDASNYERVALSCDGSADCTLAAETAGTGADDMNLHLTAAGAGRVTVNSLLSLTGIAAAPGSPAAGDIVYDSVNNLFCGYNGSAWVSFSGAGTCWAE